MADKDFNKQSTLPALTPQSKVPEAVEIPATIGPYKIASLLEKGGMSVLFLGMRPETREPTTIKVLSKKYLSNPEVVDRFLKEAGIIAMADHPNIVKLYGQGEWEGGLYIAMEFIQGISLRQYIMQTPLSLRRSLEIIIDIAYALCHLHMHGVIHRDLKPDNILVLESGAIKVIDFGIAQLLTEEGAKGSPGRQMVIGTPVYMSPEQRENPEAVSYPSDIYSLGIIAYELVLGKISHGQIHLGLMPKGLKKILTKALQPEIEDRYQDVVDFIADISTYLNSANIKKEQNIGDQITEISENLKRAQLILAPEKPPQWEGVDVGLASSKIMTVSGTYHDFFELSDGSYGVIAGESSTKEAEGFVYTAASRGMIRALCRLTNKPKELVTILNDLIIKDPMRHILILSYLIVQPKENQFKYICCGSGNLWYYPPKATVPEKIDNKNLALGIDPFVDFTDITHPWNPGDTLVLNTFAGLLSNPEQTNETAAAAVAAVDLFQEALNESVNLTPQLQVDTIFKRLKTYSSKAISDRSVCIISLRRNS